MHLDCLKQNCCKCGDSFDASQKEIVPNSQTSDATTNGSGTAGSRESTGVQRNFNFIPYDLPFSDSHSFLYIGAPDLLDIHSNAVQEVLYTIWAEIMLVWRPVPRFLQILCMLIDFAALQAVLVYWSTGLAASSLKCYPRGFVDYICRNNAGLVPGSLISSIFVHANWFCCSAGHSCILKHQTCCIIV